MQNLKSNSRPLPSPPSPPLPLPLRPQWHRSQPCTPTYLLYLHRRSWIDMIIALRVIMIMDGILLVLCSRHQIPPFWCITRIPPVLEVELEVQMRVLPSPSSLSLSLSLPLHLSLSLDTCMGYLYTDAHKLICGWLLWLFCKYMYGLRIHRWLYTHMWMAFMNFL